MRIEYTLDILKPHQPTNDLLARTLMKIKGAKIVRIKVDEIDQKTTSIYLKITGTEDLSLENVEKTLEELNCSLHSVDEVLIEEKSWE